MLIKDVNCKKKKVEVCSYFLLFNGSSNKGLSYFILILNYLTLDFKCTLLLYQVF